PAATVYVNGRVLTMESGDPTYDALGVRDGRVVARGDAADVRRAVGAGAEEVDLRGTSLMPGIVDTHPHVIHFGVIEGACVDVKDAVSHADIVARIAARAATVPKGEWIMTTPVGEPHYFLRRGWRDLAEGRLPDRHVLDRAAPDHPVWIQAWAPVIPNVIAFNTAGLAKLGITRDTPDQIEHVWIEKDAAGDPTGILRGSVTNYYTGDAFMDRLLLQLPLMQPDKLVSGMAQAQAMYARMGVTTGYEGHVMDRPLIEAYRFLRESNLLTMRILAAPEAESYALATSVPFTLDDFKARLEEAVTLVDRSDEMFKVDGVTVSRGGPCWPGFILMREPYKGPYGALTRGHSFIPKEWCEIAMRFAAEHRLRLNVIVAGSAEHDEYLDQLEAVDRDFGIKGRHWIMQHAFFVDEVQARRYAALGIDVTASMSFSWGKGDLFLERMGAHVLPDLLPLKRLLDTGMTVACGSDWGPKNIFEHIALGTTHAFCGSGRRNDGPAQKVTRAESLAMWTRDAARVLQWEGIGTLAVGNHADLIVVDRDPLTCDVETLPATQVLRTVLGGRTIFDAGRL
ncbi:MAG: amidohydrolase family protein, partial [Candidatus Binatia bacterium]